MVIPPAETKAPGLSSTATREEVFMTEENKDKGRDFKTILDSVNSTWWLAGEDTLEVFRSALVSKGFAYEETARVFSCGAASARSALHE